MKFIAAFILLTSLISCGPAKDSATIYQPEDGAAGHAGKDGKNGLDGQDGASCSTEQFDAGAILTCGSTVSVVYNGLNGQDGANGLDGEDGEDGLDGEDGTDGQDGVDGINGVDGQDGEDGEDGEDGADATGVQIATLTSSSCTQILDTGIYSKYNGSNVSFYSHSSCSSFTKFHILNDGESYWLSATLLGIKSGSTFRIINFGV